MATASSGPPPGTPALAGGRLAVPASRAPPSRGKRGEGTQSRSSFSSLRSQRDGRGEERERRICVGVIVAPHGVGGAVRIKSFTDNPADIARYGPVADEAGRQRFDVDICGAAKGALIARLSGVEDRDQAEALRGVRLYLSRAALPQLEPEEYYHADLIGLEAVLRDGTPVGHVRAIYDFGAGDTLELARRVGPPVLVPFTRTLVPVVAPAEGRLVVDPPPGLIDDTLP